MGLIEDLGPGPVALDASPFIYFVERVPPWIDLVRPVFAAIEAGKLPAVTSAMTLLEVLVGPYRAGNLLLAERFETVLTRTAGLRLIQIDRAVLRTAAFLRATARLRAPDAIHVASAIATGCRTFLTNDRHLPPIEGLRVLEVGAYVR